MGRENQANHGLKLRRKHELKQKELKRLFVANQVFFFSLVTEEMIFSGK